MPMEVTGNLQESNPEENSKTYLLPLGKTHLYKEENRKKRGEEVSNDADARIGKYNVAFV